MNSNAELLKLGQNSFRDHTFDKEIVFNDADYRETEFVNCIFENRIELNYTSGKIVFENCEFLSTEDVLIFFENESKIEFRTCTLKGNLILVGIENIYILNSDITGLIELRNKGLCNARIENTKGLHHIKGIQVSPTEEKGSFIELKNLNVEELFFSEFVPHKIRLWGGNYESVYLDDARNLNNVQIWGDDFYEEVIKIKKLSIKYLNLEGDILLKFAEIGTFELTPFTNKSGFLRMQGVRFTQEVSIQDSNLSNVQFNGVDFSRAKLYFNWSLLTEAVFANVSWPENFYVHPIYELKRKNWIYQIFINLIKLRSLRVTSLLDHHQLKIQREIYRQLKSVSLKNNSTLDALAFYKNEMNVFWLDIRLKEGKTYRELNGRDHFLIFLNKYVSNFGQSWLMPLLWMLIGHFIFCVLIWNFQVAKFCGEGTHCSSIFVSGVSQYLNWLIPLYKAPEHWTDGSKIVGVIMRVYNGFFIYHFIKATRKFGKV